MIDVVNRACRFNQTPLNENAVADRLLRLAECDPLPRWNDATLADIEASQSREKS